MGILEDKIAILLSFLLRDRSFLCKNQRILLFPDERCLSTCYFVLQVVIFVSCQSIHSVPQFS
jgi:hypothetical protein